MLELSGLEEFVRPYVGDCPAVLIEQALRKATRKFLAETYAWRTVQSISVQADKSVYALPVDTGQEILGIIDIKDDKENHLAPVSSVETLPLSMTGKPRYFASETPSVVHLAPVPKETDTLLVKVAVRLSTAGTSIPDDIFNRWGECIAEGAASYLCMERGYDWFEPGLGQAMRQNFGKEISRCKSELLRGTSAGAQQVYGGRFI